MVELNVLDDCLAELPPVGKMLLTKKPDVDLSDMSINESMLEILEQVIGL